MKKLRPPVFHIPVGATRNPNGDVVPFTDAGEQEKAMLAAWHDRTLGHPATIAAGGCVVIGPNHTMFVDIGARTVTRSDTAGGDWIPSAIEDQPR